MASKQNRPTLADMIRANVGEASVAAEAVSDSDNMREQITYVLRTSLVADPNNFYSVDGVDALAENIELVGLLDPLRVRPVDGEDGLYRIVSGHRRRAALDKLALEGNTSYEKVPVIIERGDISPAMQELRLIYANMDTRRMSSADISKQAERVERLLYELKEEGYEFPGRMRDHVAEACKVSATKLATLKKIRENLIDDWKARWEANTLSEIAAYTLAKMPAERQGSLFAVFSSRERWQLDEYALKAWGDAFKAIDRLNCPESFGGGSCSNCENMRKAVASLGSYNPPCVSCCEGCYNLAKCKYVCPKLADKVKQVKADKKAADARWKEELAVKDAPKIKTLRNLWERARVLRDASGLDVKDFYSAARGNSYLSGIRDIEGYDSGSKKIKVDSETPFGWTLQRDSIETLIAFADKLGVSLDYLLCRTDDPTPPGAVSESDTDTDTLQWHTGTPDRDGRYWTLAEDGRSVEDLYWYDSAWHLYKADEDDELTDFEVIKWYPLPEV